jgi:hypothetical protein
MILTSYLHVGVQYKRTPLLPKRSPQTYQANARAVGGLVVSILASGTQVRGFKPDRSRRIFSGEKILSMPSFAGGVKPCVPCCRCAAC